MTTELTFDQLQAISGAMPTAVEYAVTLKTVKAELDKSSSKFSAAGFEETKLGMSKPHY